MVKTTKSQDRKEEKSERDNRKVGEKNQKRRRHTERMGKREKLFLI